MLPLERRHEAAATTITAEPGQVPLTPDDFSLVMDRALARYREDEQRAAEGGSYPTLADALEIARQIQLPEEHVLAAAQELPLLRARQAQRLRRRGQLRISAWVTGYASALATGICTAAAVGVQVSMGHGWGLVTLGGLLPLLVLLWLYTGWHFWYCLRRPIADAEVAGELARAQQARAPVVIDGEL